jgi:hypothetical protein
MPCRWKKYQLDLQVGYPWRKLGNALYLEPDSKRQRFLSRGMDLDTYYKWLLCKEVPEGPNPEQDQEAVEDFNRLCQMFPHLPDIAALVISTPSASANVATNLEPEELSTPTPKRRESVVSGQSELDR